MSPLDFFKLLSIGPQILWEPHPLLSDYVLNSMVALSQNEQFDKQECLNCGWGSSARFVFPQASAPLRTWMRNRHSNAPATQMKWWNSGCFSRAKWVKPYTCTFLLRFFSIMTFYSVILCFQNAGAVIGKGGKNIKALRTDVSIKTMLHAYHELLNNVL